MIPTNSARRRFADLSEQEILALAISSEEDDARIYRHYAERLRGEYPASAAVFEGMAAEEDGHRQRLIDLHVQRFGTVIPLLRREHVAGGLARGPVWLKETMGLEAIRAEARGMERRAAEFYLRAAGRGADAAVGSARVGAHRSDMRLEDAESGLPAALASTGQQKALLIGVVLAHAALLAEARGFAPLLLLDEPAVHLDAGRRAALFAALAGLPAQVFITGTDSEPFLPLRGLAEGLRAGGGGLAEEPDFPPPSEG